MSSRRRMMMASTKRKASQIPLRDKIIFSSGKTFIVQAKSVAGHEADSVTLVSEFVVETHDWNDGSAKYPECEIHKSIMPKYYNKLNQIEKNAIIKRSFNCEHETKDDAGGGRNKVIYINASSYFWAPSGKELGLSTGKGANLGFTDNASRKKTLKNSVASGYYTTSSYYYQYRNLDDNEYYVYVISSNGIEEKPKVIASSKRLTGFETGVLPCCDVKGDSILRYKSGYWRFE